MKHYSKMTKVLMATAILFTGVLTTEGLTASALTKESIAKGRTETYYHSKNATEGTYVSNEVGTLGNECTFTIDLNKKYNKNFHSEYKHSVKAKGNKTTKTGDDICQYVQNKNHLYTGYTKTGGLIFIDGQFKSVIKGQGTKKSYNTYVTDKKLIKKYQKLGVIEKGTNNVEIVYTFIIKNPQKLTKKHDGFTFKTKYDRTASISHENVKINNYHKYGGQDSITVKNLKKGTRLNYYSGRGDLYKSVKVNGTSYTLTLPKGKDIKKELYYYKNRSLENIIISRTEPKKHESYRVKYKIPTQKKTTRTYLDNYSYLLNSGTSGMSVELVKGEDTYKYVPSLVGNKDSIYRIKYKGKTVLSYKMYKKDLIKEDDVYYMEDLISPNSKEGKLYQKMSKYSNKTMKNYTVTVQLEGKAQSLPVQLSIPIKGQVYPFITEYDE